jgi:hypothetical protein
MYLLLSKSKSQKSQLRLVGFAQVAKTTTSRTNHNVSNVKETELLRIKLLPKPRESKMLKQNKPKK